MKAQLRQWSLQIDHLAAKTQKLGARTRFEDLMYIDELKALYALAQLKFDKFRAATNAERAHLKMEMKSAWDDLEAALKNAMP